MFYHSILIYEHIVILNKSYLLKQITHRNESQHCLYHLLRLFLTTPPTEGFYSTKFQWLKDDALISYV